jgi:hypothetical protein
VWRIPRPYSRISRQEPLLFLPSSSSVVLTRLSGPRFRPITFFFFVVPRNRTQDLWICSQELWSLDHRGGPRYHVPENHSLDPWTTLWNATREVPFLRPSYMFHGARAQVQSGLQLVVSKIGTHVSSRRICVGREIKITKSHSQFPRLALTSGKN